MPSREKVFSLAEQDGGTGDPGAHHLERTDAESIVTHLGEDPRAYMGAVVPPIYQNSLFVFEDIRAMERAFEPGQSAGRSRAGDYLYTRESNPTTAILETKLAALEGAEAARAFGSGMAAISAAIMSCVAAGRHIVTIDHVYGPARKFLTEYLPRFGVETTFVDGRDPADFERAARPETSLFYLESPSTGVFHLQDIAAVCAIAKPRGFSVVIDNSWATPVFQKPLALGCDLVVHSMPKYLGGHSDLVAGCAMGSRERIARLSEMEGSLLGGILGPFGAWLVLRGLRTLPIRMKEAMARGLAIARFLERHPKVARVNHPFLPSHPQHDLALRQMSGASGLFSFELKDWDAERVRRFIESLRLFQLGVSWGGHESLVMLPGVHSRKDLERPSAIRLSVGFEPVDALQEDLEQALAHA